MQKKLLRGLLSGVSLLLSITASAQSTGTLYFSSGASNTQLHRVDNPGTAAVSVTTIGSPYSTIYNGIGYYNGSLYGITGAGQVVSINPANGAVTPLSISLPSGHNYASGDIANGILYTTNIDGGPSNHFLYKINIANGTYTSVACPNQFADFAYYNGYLYGSAGQQGSYYVYQINPNTGATTQVGGNTVMGSGAAAWSDGTGMIYFDRLGTYNVNTNVATVNTGEGTTAAGIAGSSSGYDDATLGSASNTPVTNGGTIGSNQSACGTYDPATLTSITPASGGSGSGTIQYRWWANGVLVTGATSASYDPGPITVTTNYQREANRTGTATWVGSNVVTVTIDAACGLTNGGTIASNQSGCGTYDPATLTSTTPASGGSGSGAIQYRWRVNGTLVTGATADTFNPGPVSATTTYVREANRTGTSNWVVSNTVTVTINTACDPDFTIDIDQNGSSELFIGQSLPTVVYVQNLTSTPSIVSFSITKPSPSSGLTLTFGSSSTWTVTTGPGQYIFTSNIVVEGNGTLSIPVTINRVGGSKGDFTLNGTILNTNDSNPDNNNSSITVTKL